MIVKDKWMSEQIGKGVYNVDVSYGLVKCKHNSIYCIKTKYLKDIPINRNVTGFRFINTEITLEGSRIYPRITYKEGKIDNTLRIAESCYKYDRWHMDSQVDNKIADKIKRSWLKNCIDKKRGDKVFIIENGFLVARIEGEKNKCNRIAIIDLIGVDPEYQNEGIGTKLVKMFTGQYYFYKYRVTTQLENIASMRLYEKLGFKIVDYKYVLHYHN